MLLSILCKQLNTDFNPNLVSASSDGYLKQVMTDEELMIDDLLKNVSQGRPLLNTNNNNNNINSNRNKSLLGNQDDKLMEL